MASFGILAVGRFVQLLLVVVVVSFVSAQAPGAPPPSDTTIGTFGPLNVYQPFADWLYPIDESFPLQMTLGNASLAFAFGFEMAYGITPIDDPENYIQMETMSVSQDDPLFNFTGNLLSNRFWWNATAEPLPEGQYRLVTQATFSACSDGSEPVVLFVLTEENVNVTLETTFSVGDEGSIPANTTGNDLTDGGNTTDITEGMWLCTALGDSKRQVTIGLIGTYGAGILFTAITMLVVRGQNPIDS